MKPSIRLAQYNKLGKLMTEAQVFSIVHRDSCVLQREKYPDLQREKYPDWPSTVGGTRMYYCTQTASGLFPPSANLWFSDGLLSTRVQHNLHLTSSPDEQPHGRKAQMTRGRPGSGVVGGRMAGPWFLVRPAESSQVGPAGPGPTRPGGPTAGRPTGERTGVAPACRGMRGGKKSGSTHPTRHVCVRRSDFLPLWG
ncbi:hypothetical protein [Streptomyces sp. NPDC046197]|uniref:hypothetical protein n=1 Tax=Streptomyces sp. NPDC046197 TaxID=3154337 RepID=UPI0033E58E23